MSERDDIAAALLAQEVLAQQALAQQVVPHDEHLFQQGIRATPWFSEYVGKYGEQPDLNTPDYNYRKAWVAGARPDVRDPGDQLLHWPSTYKGASHPNRYVDDIDTITGKRR